MSDRTNHCYACPKNAPHKPGVYLLSTNPDILHQFSKVFPGRLQAGRKLCKKHYKKLGQIKSHADNATNIIVEMRKESGMQTASEGTKVQIGDGPSWYVPEHFVSLITVLCAGNYKGICQAFSNLSVQADEKSSEDHLAVHTPPTHWIPCWIAFICACMRSSKMHGRRHRF